MAKQIAINISLDGCAFTVTTRMSAASISNLTRGGHFPSTGVIVITDVKKKQAFRSGNPQALARTD